MTHDEFRSTLVDGYYKCLECDEWVYRSYMSSHLSGHGITTEQYYTKYVSAAPECHHPECNNTVPMYKLAQGWCKYCSNSCSQSHKTIIQNDKRWNGDGNEVRRAEVGKYLGQSHKNPEARYSRNISKAGNATEADIYLCICDGVCKYGFTVNSHEKRMAHVFNNMPYELVKVWTLPVIVAARIESELVNIATPLNDPRAPIEIVSVDDVQKIIDFINHEIGN